MVLSALAPLLVYVIARPSLGRRVAVLAALLLAVLPRWLHASVVGSDGVPVAVLAGRRRFMFAISSVCVEPVGGVQGA